MNNSLVRKMNFSVDQQEYLEFLTLSEIDISPQKNDEYYQMYENFKEYKRTNCGHLTLAKVFEKWQMRNAIFREEPLLQKLYKEQSNTTEGKLSPKKEQSTIESCQHNEHIQIPPNPHVGTDRTNNPSL